MKKVFLLFIALAMLNTVQAIELTEVMYNPAGTDSGREWLEFRAEEVVNISNLKFFDNSGPHTTTFIQGNQILNSGDFIIITNNEINFQSDYPFYTGNLVKSSFSLLNTGEAVGLTINGTEASNDTYPTDIANGNNYTATNNDGFWTESTIQGGSPGFIETNEIPEFGLAAGIISLIAGLVLFQAFRRK